MIPWRRQRAGNHSRREPRNYCPRTRPALEPLEDRQVPTVTYHGGALLPHVETQALYYGSDWYTNSTYYNQAVSLEGYLKSVVNSSFMDTLGNAGYGVGRGSADGGMIWWGAVNKSTPLADSAIRSTIQSGISRGWLKTPDSNLLYVVFVEANVAVTMGGLDSKTGFLGYHGAFAGTDTSGTPKDIRYAVISYPGGSVGNASVPWLSTVDNLTEVASHELAEAVTDPDVNYKTIGWYDDSQRGEVGDLANQHVVHLNGFAVQRIADRNDQPMTPAGAASSERVTFVLLQNGYLYKLTGAGLSFLAAGVVSVSDQGIDDRGQAMVNLVTTYGNAWEYHDGSGWTFLGFNAKSAKAGQGVSYVLLNTGNLYEYRDATGAWNYVDSFVTAIDAGTDRTGVNLVAEVNAWGNAWEHSDTSGWRYLGANVRSVSAGQQGTADFVTTSGTAYLFLEAAGQSYSLASNVASVTAGTDASGNFSIDLLFNDNNLYEFHVGSGWSWVGCNIKTVAKARAGLVDVVSTWGNAWAHDCSGWAFLTGNALAAI